MKRPALMYCCRSEKHAGQLRRSMEVARKLSDTFDVTVLLSAAALDFVDVPDNIEIVLLPAFCLTWPVPRCDISRHGAA